MTKGYIVACITVIDPRAYAEYAKDTVAALAAHGGRALVRGGRFVPLEGDPRTRTVVLEFDSVEQAQAYYHSEAYQAAKVKRADAAVADIVAVEGAV